VTEINTSIPAVLRRRAAALDGLHGTSYCRVFLAAADALDVYGQTGTHTEQQNLQLIAENRRLRHALVDLGDLVLVAALSKTQQAKYHTRISRIVNATRPVGEGRALLTVEILPGQTRAHHEAGVAALFDRHFGRGGTAPRPTDLVEYHHVLGPLAEDQEADG